MDILPISILQSVIEYKKRRRRKEKGYAWRTLSVCATGGFLSLVEQVARGHRAVRISSLKYDHRANLYRSSPVSLTRINFFRPLPPPKNIFQRIYLRFFSLRFKDAKLKKWKVIIEWVSQKRLVVIGRGDCKLTIYVKRN